MVNDVRECGGLSLHNFSQIPKKVNIARCPPSVVELCAILNKLT